MLAQIKVMEYLPSTSEVLVASSMPTPGEGGVAYRCLASAGSKDGLVVAVEDPATSDAEGDDLNVVLLRIPTLSAGEGGDEDGAAHAEVVVRLSSPDAGSAFVRAARWKPVLDEDDSDDDEGSGGVGGASTAAAALPPLVTVAPDFVAVWAVRPGDAAAEITASWRPAAFGPPLTAAAFDPSAPCRLVLAAGPDLLEWDGTSPGSAAVTVVTSAHGGARLLDVHCNPNRQRIAVTAGEDGCARVWDLKPAAADGAALRGPAAALLCLRGHGHWCTAVRFNPFHDQLLVSAGTDGGVCLWSAPSTSSAPVGEEDEDDGARPPTTSSSRGKAPTDAVLRRWAPHADAVPSSCVAWSAGSAWVLATASVEGRVAAREVPPDAKYKILLR